MSEYSRRHHESDSATLAATPSHMRIDPQTRAVVGAVIGSVVGIIVAIVGFLLWRQYRKRRSTLRREDQENPGVLGDTAEGKSSQGEKGDDSVLERPSSVYSSRPLSDPFSAEVKTRDGGSPLAAPQPSEGEERPIANASPGSGPPLAVGIEPPLEVMKRPPFDMRSSTEISGIPRLSKTFIAKVRATTRSPPPV